MSNGKSLSFACEGKATGTLVKRAASLQLYIDWADASGGNPFPLSESTAYAHVEFLSDTRAPPTRAAAFKEAVGFAKGAGGLRDAEGALLSARFRGAVFALLKRKRVTVKVEAWTVVELIRMETALEATLFPKLGGAPELETCEAVLIGFLMFAIYTRSRFGDAARIIIEPKLDLPKSVDFLEGFIEASTTGGQVKSGQAAAKHRRTLPVVGPAGGVSGVSWAAAYLEVRKRADPNAKKDGTLMPVPLVGGAFGEGRLPTGCAGVWLRSVLRDLGETRYLRRRERNPLVQGHSPELAGKGRGRTCCAQTARWTREG